MISSVLLLVLLLGLIGIPLSRPAAPKERRFPCEDCPCGCFDADYCWDKCCCHSDDEKLQWASRNGVTPPNFLITRVARAKNTSSLAMAASSSAGSCCRQCPTDRPTVNTSSHDPAPDKSATHDSAARVHRLVLLDSAAKCRGIELVWSLLSCAVVNTQPAMITRPNPPLLYRLPIFDEWAPSVSASIDPPVP